MLTLGLSEEQGSYLQIILKGRLSDLAFEIARTDSRSFREELRRRYDLISGILAIMPPLLPEVPVPAQVAPGGP